MAPSTSRVVQYNVTQFTAAALPSFYARLNNAIRGGNGTDKEVVYNAPMRPEDYGIVAGEGLFSVKEDKMRGVYRCAEEREHPIVFASLNGFYVQRGGTATKRQKLADLVEFVGFAGKDVAYNKDGEIADAPIVITSGPVSTWNTGTETLKIGDYVSMVLPDETKNLALKDGRRGFSKEKRTFVMQRCDSFDNTFQSHLNDYAAQLIKVLEDAGAIQKAPETNMPINPATKVKWTFAEYLKFVTESEKQPGDTEHGKLETFKTKMFYEMMKTTSHIVGRVTKGGGRGDLVDLMVNM
jgi:hypothetical protein